MPSAGYVSRNLSGWGRFPVEPCHLYRPEKQRETAAILDSGLDPSYIPRGLGRSYGDASLNREAGAISTARLNRFLAFDAETGLLECESGVSLAEIIEVFLPRGFFLPVTPGTKFVTLGGAIAADVHGKNHHQDGTIAQFVQDFRLLTPAGLQLQCSRSENSQVFWATLGGMGLTGMIQSARIKLLRVESAYVRVDYEKAGNLDAALDQMSASDDRYRYSVAWIDALARGGSLGRSVLMRGDHAAAADVASRARSPLAARARRALSVPFDLPALALNSLTVSAFNALYYAGHVNGAGHLVDFDRFFYPLDAIRDWNRVYGKRGFVQYQVVLPLESSRAGLRILLERLAGSRRASFLAVLKRFGKANQGPLSFPAPGWTLALDLPVTRDLPEFLGELDDVVVDHGGRVYLAKDAVLRPEKFARMYPRLDEFRAVKQRLDPQGRVSSSLARRLKIVEL